MHRLLISALAAASLTAAVTPAFSQPYGGYGRGDYSRDPNRNNQDYNRNNQDYNRGYNYSRGSDNIDAREAEIERRIDDGYRRGDLSAGEVRRLRNELRVVQVMETRYRRNGYDRGPGGLTPAERADLDRRLDRLSGMVFQNRHSYDRRYR